VLGGDRFDIDLAVSSRLLEASYEGAVQQRPLPALDGSFALDVGSVGKLAAWLGRPLPADQPDPGPLKVRATAAADGARLVLSEAMIEGEGLTATATGSVDRSGPVRKVDFTIEADSLDIDRYLPPPAAAETAEVAAEPAAPARPADLLAMIPDTPFDLAHMRTVEGQVSVRIGRLRAKGYEAAPVVLRSQMAGGVHRMEIVELGLYGGTVRAAVAADGSGDALAIDASLDIEDVEVARLAEAAAVPVSGIASGAVRVSGRGASPRALAESLVAEVDLALAGIESQDAVGVSEVVLAASLPGLDGAPKANGAVVYNGERVEFALALDPVAEVLDGDRFDVDLSLASRLIEAAYKGAIQQRPVPGLDGAFSLDIGSVGELAAWLGRPLPPARPDPGPLRLEATLATEGTAVALSDAAIESTAFSATASGSFDGGGEVPTFDAALTIARLDTNALLPPPEEAPGEPGEAQAPAAPAAEPGDWSDEPIDASALRGANGKVTIDVRDVLYRDLAIDSLKARASLDGGVLTATVEELRLAGGAITAEATVDGSGDALGLAYTAAAEGLEAKPLLATFAGVERLLGTMAFAAGGTARGASERQIVGSLDGEGMVAFTDGAIEGINIAATLRRAGSLDFGGEEGEAPRTDFSELGGTFTITDGVIENRDLRMLAPLVRLDGAGLVPMPPRMVDYRVTAKLVASLEGQGGQDALSGIPIPVAITGPWHQPDYEVDLDTVFAAIAKDPARIAALPLNVAEKAAEIGLELPVAILEGGGGAVGEILEAVPGGDLLRDVLPLPGTGGEGEASGGPLEVLRDILPLPAGEPAPAPAPAPAPVEAQPAPAPAPAEEEPALPDPVGVLEDLLRR
jgi:AsmA protein